MYPPASHVPVGAGVSARPVGRFTVPNVPMPRMNVQPRNVFPVAPASRVARAGTPPVPRTRGSEGEARPYVLPRLDAAGDGLAHLRGASLTAEIVGRMHALRHHGGQGVDDPSRRLVFAQVLEH